MSRHSDHIRAEIDAIQTTLKLLPRLFSHLKQSVLSVIDRILSLLTATSPHPLKSPQFIKFQSSAISLVIIDDSFSITRDSPAIIGDWSGHHR